MNIESISINADCYVNCTSCFYTCHDVLNRSRHSFSKGINILEGEIDSGVWALSYLLSMYPYARRYDIILSDAELAVNGGVMSLSEFSEYSCYLDVSYPLFDSKRTVRHLVEKGLKKRGDSRTANDICNLFYMSPDRFDRPISGTGNERWKAMAAIGYAHGKQVFCFPWISSVRFIDRVLHLALLPYILEDLGMTVILPLSESCSLPPPDSNGVLLRKH